MHNNRYSPDIFASDIEKFQARMQGPGDESNNSEVHSQPDTKYIHFGSGNLWEIPRRVYGNMEHIHRQHERTRRAQIYFSSASMQIISDS